MIEGWLALVGTERGRAAGLDLLARYGEPHRRYHTVRHLEEVLAIVDELAVEADDPAAVRMAAWFHDAIYAIGHVQNPEPHAPPRLSNEEASAQLAEQVLAELGVDEGRVREAARLVRLTETHRMPEFDWNAAVLCDADLAILGAAPERYRQYVREVREEYAVVPDEVFRPARAEILRSLLTAPSLFHTEVARDRYEKSARANLAEEIAALSARAGGSRAST
jgi:predicted metal-dependent HD superfamily phosphohydrolase